MCNRNYPAPTGVYKALTTCRSTTVKRFGSGELIDLEILGKIAASDHLPIRDGKQPYPRALPTSLKGSFVWTET